MPKIIINARNDSMEFNQGDVLLYDYTSKEFYKTNIDELWKNYEKKLDELLKRYDSNYSEIEKKFDNLSNDFISLKTIVKEHNTHMTEVVKNFIKQEEEK